MKMTIPGIVTGIATEIAKDKAIDKLGDMVELELPFDTVKSLINIGKQLENSLALNLNIGISEVAGFLLASDNKKEEKETTKGKQNE